MKYKNIEKGKVYKMKPLEDILKIKGVELREEGLYYKYKYMDISVMKSIYEKEVRVMLMSGEKDALNIGVNLANNTDYYPYMQKITVKFLKKLDKDSN